MGCDLKPETLTLIPNRNSCCLDESVAHLSSTSLTVLRWLLLSHWTPPTTSAVR